MARSSNGMKAQSLIPTPPPTLLPTEAPTTSVPVTEPPPSPTTTWESWDDGIRFSVVAGSMLATGILIGIVYYVIAHLCHCEVNLERRRLLP